MTSRNGADSGDFTSGVNSCNRGGAADPGDCRVGCARRRDHCGELLPAALVDRHIRVAQRDAVDRDGVDRDEAVLLCKRIVIRGCCDFHSTREVPQNFDSTGGVDAYIAFFARFNCPFDGLVCCVIRTDCRQERIGAVDGQRQTGFIKHEAVDVSRLLLHVDSCRVGKLSTTSTDRDNCRANGQRGYLYFARASAT
ncbi:hypothetical protein SDC9_143660 [bioreactor metagenome]|uniref:Uncharacterized protein n=1 Tax=bioreactor metagenome TaxID=1076179 RepID=A0A645E4J0_9ZZZZ